MLVVKVKDGEKIERALKRLKESFAILKYYKRFVTKKSLQNLQLLKDSK